MVDRVARAIGDSRPMAEDGEALGLLFWTDVIITFPTFASPPFPPPPFLCVCKVRQPLGSTFNISLFSPILDATLLGLVNGHDTRIEC